MMKYNKSRRRQNYDIFKNLVAISTTNKLKWERTLLNLVALRIEIQSNCVPLVPGPVPLTNWALL